MKATRPQSTESATRETATWALDRAARRSCALRRDRSSWVTAGIVVVGAACMDEESKSKQSLHRPACPWTQPPHLELAGKLARLPDRGDGYLNEPGASCKPGRVIRRIYIWGSISVAGDA
uniref:Uncharacterized protein n=1 Tax=Arundo donax TaxID=35708 RepID=A0A0A9GE70_ARUDO